MAGSKYILTKIGKRKELMIDGVMAMDDHDDQERRLVGWL